MQGCHARIHFVLSEHLAELYGETRDIDEPTQRDPAHRWSPAIDHRTRGEVRLLMCPTVNDSLKRYKQRYEGTLALVPDGRLQLHLHIAARCKI